MNNYQGIFKRYEKKYVITDKQYASLMNIIGEKLEDDLYPTSKIANIYFDTPDNLLIRRSLEKPVYKEKLRLRSYTTVNADDNVFIELKKKYKGIVYKRRTTMALHEANDFLIGHLPPSSDNQITQEIQYFLKFYPNLIPSMYIAYNRKSLKTNDDTGIRITFDKNIIWRTTDLDLTVPMYGNAILQGNQRVMEIKTPTALPLWLTNAFSELSIYPTSFSKYGRGYLDLLNETFRKVGNLYA